MAKNVRQKMKVERVVFATEGTKSTEKIVRWSQRKVV